MAYSFHGYHLSELERPYQETIGNGKFCVQVSNKNIINYANEIEWAFEEQLTAGMKGFSSKAGRINWCCLFPGTMKLNTDASCKQRKRSGVGGVIRNKRGEWVRDFYGKLHICQALEAELQAIYTGLGII